MNKKGDVELSLSELIKITLMILVLLVFLFITYKIIKMVTGGPSQDEKDNFNSVMDEIDLMLEKTSTFEFSRSILALKEDRSIRGFSEGEAKPMGCEGKLCICLYATSKYEDINVDSPVECRKLESRVGKRIILLSPWSKPGEPPYFPDYPESLSGVDYFTFMFIPYTGYGGVVVYIEKYSTSDTDYIFMAKIIDEIPEIPSTTTGTIGGNVESSVFSGISTRTMNRRIAYLTPCPEGSHPNCLGMLKNYVSGGGFCKWDGIKNICTYIDDLPACAMDEKAKQDCICGSILNLRDYYCITNDQGKAASVYMNCKKVTGCTNYCLIDDDDVECSTREEEGKCVLNVCKLDTTCVIKEATRMVNNPDYGIIEGAPPTIDKKMNICAEA
jgi:hypothetical protein